ncbi:MAG: molybdopterin-dependent oxidoreductase [Anaerolineae bacterium]|nr:molybdopterin-dependent oxidoreductase [Anaerolineae bacterium]
MRRLSIPSALLVAFLLTFPLVAVLYLAAVLIGVAFPPFNLFDLVARLLPGNLLTFGIDLMVDSIRALNLGATDDTAKLAEQTMAVAMFAGITLGAALIYLQAAPGLLARSATFSRDSRLSGIVFGLVFGTPFLLISLSLDRAATAPTLATAVWLIAAFGLWGLVLGQTLYLLTRQMPEPTREAGVTPLSRRQFLIQIGGAAATITLFGTGLAALINSSRATATELLSAGGDIAARLPNANDPVQPAPGTRPEYTPLGQHYRIDINTGSGPALDEETYRLAVNGLVEAPLELTLEEIRALPSMEQFVTMSCISNRLAGDLISTTLWMGTSMQNLLDLARPLPEATHIKITAADGFDEYVDLATIRGDETVMLAWAWDGQALTQRHGFPLRIHIPNHYGMKQPKWITGMEFVSEWGEGYWVRRGWDRDALVPATSVIDTVAVDMMVIDAAENRFVPIGGIAWAGTRGIAQVEVQVDGGEWQDAQLRRPLSDRAWVIWRYDWQFEPGEHTFAVRCVEADGTPQIETVEGVRPSGATGIHSVSETL